MILSDGNLDRFVGGPESVDADGLLHDASSSSKLSDVSFGLFFITDLRRRMDAFLACS